MSPREAESLFLAIEIGGTKLQLGLGRGDGEILALRRAPIDPSRGASAILGQIRDAAGPLLAELGRGPGEIQAAGIGFGGPVDARAGVVRRSFQVEGWDGFDLAGWARGALGIPRVALANDADAAALAEATVGAGAGLSPILYVNSGSGIGGGLVVDGAIYEGCGVGAVEVGHLRVEVDGRTVELEEVASGWGIGRAAADLLRGRIAAGGDLGALGRLVGGDPGRVTAAEAAAAAVDGDEGAARVYRRAAEAMARGLNHAVTLLGPRRVVLGGGVSLAPEALWLDPIRRALDAIGFAPLRGSFDVVPARLGEGVVIHGALAMAARLARSSLRET